MAPAAAAAVPVTAPATEPAKAYAFEVVSIRQDKSAPSAGMQSFGPTADGYRMTNMLIGEAIITAYVPQVGGTAFYTSDQVKGLPNWVNTERYDIDARIGDEDRAEWQKPEAQRAMLQAMFAERCKLAMHREVKEAEVYSMVVAKGGPKFKETDPTVEHPGGQKQPWGGVIVPAQNGLSFYGATMTSLASFISALANPGHPVQDKTGLTGKYDLVMKFPPPPPPPAPGEPQSATAAPDPRGSMAFSVLNDLGLKLEPAKGQVETLVIDHMERPSEN
jgi:uncharacterized protein (TIGR03435 family)